MPTEIHPIACPEVLPQLQNTLTHGFAIAEHPCFQALNSDANLRLRLLVANGLKPIGKRFLAIACLVSENFDRSSKATAQPAVAGQAPDDGYDSFCSTEMNDALGTPTCSTCVVMSS